MKALTIAAGLTTLATSAMAQTPVLTIYTYDSFTSEWGPGPVIEEAFEADCACDLEFVSVGDGAELLSRLRLEGARTDADIVLGLDTNLTATAKDTGLFAPHGVQDMAFDLPIAWEDDTFLPYDWGYFAFVYDNTRIDTPPASFAELADSDLSVIVMDPRTSTPGLGLLLWAKSVYGDAAPAFWEDLSDQIVTVTKGWSEGYGMFQEGEADLVLSYTTSPAYHILFEEDDTKSALAFDEGNYMQIEVAGKIASTDQPELADRFLAFMTSDAFQSVIPTTNWMYPAVTPADGLPAGFEEIVDPAKALIYGEDEAQQMRDVALEEWRAALSQ